MKKINISKEILENLYINKKLSLKEVAEKFGVSYQTISNKLKEYGIQSRTISEALKGEKNGFYGKKHTENTKIKISEANLGRHHSEEAKRKISEVLKGEKHPMYGKHHSKETKKKISETKSGKHLSEETKRKLSEVKKGKKHPNWKGCITPKNTKIRSSLEMRLWKKAVFERDNFTCQKCGKKGGDLHAHHINNFADFPELRVAIDNGITLCKECHKEFHRLYGKKNNTRSQIDEFIKH
jgi:5-methylcytosine-specific restriction endonuclease McrA/predicted DNA-binding protein YlxM (UPF0122 family)